MSPDVFRNPFEGALSIFVDSVDSTMRAARALAGGESPPAETVVIRSDAPDTASGHGRPAAASPVQGSRACETIPLRPGSFVMSEFQTQGRGRVLGRNWETKKGTGLLFTVIFAAETGGLPGFPLRVGYAVAKAIGAMYDGAMYDGAMYDGAMYDGAIESKRHDERAGRVAVKWPNDVMIDGKKVAGILCERSESATLVGIGVNCLEGATPPGLEDRAISIERAFGRVPDRIALLESILSFLKKGLADERWLKPLSEVLFGLGREMRVACGSASSPEYRSGVILGIDPQGCLLLGLPDGSTRTLASGEIPSGGESGVATLKD